MAFKAISILICIFVAPSWGDPDCDVTTTCPSSSFKSCEPGKNSTTLCKCEEFQTVEEDNGQYFCLSCLEPNTSYFGNNILPKPIQLNQQDCQIQCQNENNSGQNCQEQCKNATSWQGCQIMCQSHEKCKLWTFDKVRRLCYLKDGRGIEYKTAREYHSGLKTCNPNHIVPSLPDPQPQISFPARIDVKNVPLVNVLHKSGGRSVLPAIPATFGKQITRDVTVEGVAQYVNPKTFCLEINPNSKKDEALSGTIAVIERGGCKFVFKVRNAQIKGYSGVIILDTRAHTGFNRITGDHSDYLTIPSVFLLKPAADKLRKMLRFQDQLDIFIQDSHSFSNVYQRPSTILKASEANSSILSYTKDGIEKSIVFRSHGPDSNDHPQLAVYLGSLKFSPVMIIFFVVMTVLFVLFAITAAAYCMKCYKNSQRRSNRTHCQQAMAEMDAHYRRQSRMSQQNGNSDGHSLHQLDAGALSNHLNTDQALKVLECPVCLEIALPPRKIFQCMQGHIICQKCKDHPQLINCPICRQKLNANAVSRNLALENLAHNLIPSIEDTPVEVSVDPVPSAPPAHEDTSAENIVEIHAIDIPEDIGILPSHPSSPSQDIPSNLTVNLPPESS